MHHRCCSRARCREKCNESGLWGMETRAPARVRGLAGRAGLARACPSSSIHSSRDSVPTCLGEPHGGGTPSHGVRHAELTHRASCQRRVCEGLGEYTGRRPLGVPILPGSPPLSQGQHRHQPDRTPSSLAGTVTVRFRPPSGRESCAIASRFSSRRNLTSTPLLARENS